jgi:hypothetical protein
MNLGQNALQFLKTVAPTLATALGGPLAGMATTAILGAFGIKTGSSSSDTKALEAAVSGATPEQIAAIQKAENDFKVQMEQLHISEEQLQYADTADARARDIAVRDSTPTILAYLVTAGFFGVLIFMLVKGVPRDTGGDVLLVMMGALGAAWTSVISFFFGSSAGGRKAVDTLSTIAKQP